jgi:predicted ATPase
MGPADLVVKRYILTGAPGSGKTSVIKEMDQHGRIVVHEAATDIIAGAQAKGIEKPWEEARFVDDIIIMQRKRQMTTHGALQFFDRSPFCTYALGNYLAQLQNTEFQPSQVLAEEIDRCLAMRIYQPKVFFLENLGFIEHTAARKISFADSLVFEQVHVCIYQKFGFEVILVPPMPVAKRHMYILEHIGL